MNLFKMTFLLFVSGVAGAANALTVHSVSYPTEAPGYIKVIVKPTEAVAAADILFVVDNSGSMDLHQKNLSGNIQALVSELAGFAGSVNAGVITTDMDTATQSGRMQGAPAVLSSSNPDFSILLSQRLLPGTDGSAYEKPLAAIFAALTEPLLSTVNAGFLRPNVPLNIILMTDEDDQSNIGQIPFVESIKAKRPTSEVSFFAIVPQTCGWSDGDGSKLKNVVSLFKGEIHDLCSADWGGKLRSIGSSIGRQVMRTVRLPTEPVARTIEVTFGSKTLVGGDSYGGWVYDRNQMAVVIGEGFDFSSEPVGTELEIRFVPKYWQN